MVGIVKIHNDETRAGTFLISKGFERPHKRIIELIGKHKERFIRLDNKSVSNVLIISKVPAKKAGRPVEEFLLNEAQTIFLGSLFRNTEIVLDFKERLAADFVKTKKQLYAIQTQQKEPEWKQARLTSTTIRKFTTDIIQEFIQYAKDQGGTPKGCDKYYSNLTKMVNSMLFIVSGKFKNIRDVLTPEQLFTVGAVEQVIKKTLREEMDKGIFYKDIYQSCKKKTEIFADLHGKSDVINKILSLN